MPEKSASSYAKNITNGPLAEFVDGQRVIIEPGKIAAIPAERVAALGKQVEKSTEKDFAAQLAAEKKN